VVGEQLQARSGADAIVGDGQHDPFTDSNGEVVERYEYDPYGNTYISDVDGTGDHDDTSYRTYSRFGNPWMWTGQRHDATTGTYHFWARTFSPNLGRWVQRDPLSYIDGLNMREYVSGNPTSWTDPLGLWVTPDILLDIGGLAWDAYDNAVGSVKQIPFILGVEGASYGDAKEGIDQARDGQIGALADLGAAVIPGVTGAGAAVRAARHADDIADAAKAADKILVLLPFSWWHTTCSVA
jgi:RHS repeat-associated protein